MTNSKSDLLMLAILGIIITIGASLFIYFSNNHLVERQIIYATSGAYFLWSLLYHYFRGDLHFSIIIEYLVFALLAVVITTSTLF